MKKVLAIFVLALTLLPAVASADSFGIDAAARSANLKKSVAGGDSVQSVVGGLINIVLSMVGVIFFVIIVYAGFNWMIARGNSEQVDRSKGMIEGAVIGLIIIMAAYAITRFVFESLDKGVAANTGGAPADELCIGKLDQESCGLNMQCNGGQCISKCQAQGGTCGAATACVAPKVVHDNLCPGDVTVKCCY